MIKLIDVWQKFGDTTVLNGVNLHVQRGDTMVIMGGSGCGKSVTLKLILGLLKPERGEIWIAEEEISR